MAPYSRKRARAGTIVHRPIVMRRKKPVTGYYRQRMFARQVKAIMRKAAETKRTSGDPKTYSFNAAAQNCNDTMSTPVDLTSQFCNIPPGTEDGQRIGERVMTKSAQLKLIVQPSATDARPCIVQVFVGYYRPNPGEIPTPANLTNIFDAGENSSSADGTLLSLVRPVNKDAFHIAAYKQFKVGGSTGGSLTTDNDNNDFPLYQAATVNLSKEFGTLTFNAPSNVPSNKHLYMFCNFVYAVGTLHPGIGSDARPRVTYYLDYRYTDV